MTRQEAIQWCKDIQSGKGIDKDEMLKIKNPGMIAAWCWNDNAFTLGMEYGVLFVLIKIFDLTKEDLKMEEEIKL